MRRVAALYRENYELQLPSAGALQKFVELIRNSPPFALRRRVAALIQRWSQFISHWRFSKSAEAGGTPARPVLVQSGSGG